MSVKNITKNRFSAIVPNLTLGEDGIWSSEIPSGEQESERKLREQVASKSPDNYINDIAKHHSIPVMDYEAVEDTGSRCYLDRLNDAFSGCEP